MEALLLCRHRVRSYPEAAVFRPSSQAAPLTSRPWLPRTDDACLCRRHPYDEVIGAGGSHRFARLAAASVSVLFVTNRGQ